MYSRFLENVNRGLANCEQNLDGIITDFRHIPGSLKNLKKLNRCWSNVHKLGTVKKDFLKQEHNLNKFSKVSRQTACRSYSLNYFLKNFQPILAKFQQNLDDIFVVLLCLNESLVDLNESPFFVPNRL